MIEKRLSKLSYSEEEFRNATAPYEKALSESGHNKKLVYENDTKNEVPDSQNKKRRKRNVLWFNPPYNKNVATNVGQKFFQLIRKHFPQNSKYSKIFNRNTIKLSYSCSPNIGMFFQQHNKYLTENKICQQTTSQQCSCRNKDECPLNGNCLQSTVTYEANVTTNTDVFQ